MKNWIILSNILLVSVLSGCANNASKVHHDDMRQAHSTKTVPVEVGQGAFAAIAEMVERLQADKTTDWSAVSIDELREHLVDMSLVTLFAEVISSSHGDGTMQYVIEGDAQVGAAIRRMVQAHAAMVDRQAGWKTTVEATARGMTLTVEGLSDAAREQVRGLGFFGFMALDSHHQPHHEAIARGGRPHH